MPNMLGKELIARGAINQEDLDRALRAQLSHGGHLGTCLIEDGSIDEQQLGEMLGSILGVPHAEASFFHNIPAVVLGAIPSELVEKHQVVPFRIEDRTLHVAMINPRNLLVIDELQFAAGMAIEAWVAPEVRIVLALETYYGVPRSRRFLLLSPDPSFLPDATSSGKPDGTSKDTKVRRVPAYPVSQSPVWANLDPENDYQRKPLHDLSAAIDRLNDAMCAATDTQELSHCVLDCLSVGLERSILFQVHDLVARIWDWRGFDASQDIASDLTLSVAREPLFQLIAETGAYLGRPEVPRNEGLYHELDIDVPANVLLVPVYSNDQLVAMLYGDGGPAGDIPGELSDYRRVARKLGPALEIQVLERKLRRI
jgi:hypothetical protein